MLAEQVQEIDLIIGGHSHDAVEDEQIGRVTIVQAVSDASTLGEARILWEDGRVREVESRLHTLWNDTYPPDAEAARLLEELRRPHRDTLEEVIAEAAEPIGRNYRSESPFDVLTGEILCQHTSAQIAFLPGIGYGVTLLPGPITREALYRLLPHPATVVTLDLTGRQVLEILEQSATNQKPDDPQEIVGGLVQTAGLRWTVDFRRLPGQRIRDVYVRDTPLDEAAVYRAVTNSGMLGGLHRYHSFAEGKNIARREEKLVEVVENAMRAMGVVHAPPAGSIRRLE
jgi:2',3'-cyclic-nucleotide 2'-phosphodiesterase (5'-nucleotidase family)